MRNLVEQARAGIAARLDDELMTLLADELGCGFVGRDRGRGASRSFRLGRILGAVRPVGAPGAFDPPTDSELAEALTQWTAGPERVAALAVVPDRAAALRARSVDDEAFDPSSVPGAGAVLAERDLVHVRYRSTWELAEELVGYGAAVVVLGPEPLRDATVHLLRTASRLDIPGGARG